MDDKRTDVDGDLSGDSHDRERIIREIAACCTEGSGIVPLIGSGMSVASGIPAGKDYRQYLFRCLAHVFGAGGPVPDASDRQWDPRELRWPSYKEVRPASGPEWDKLEWSQTTLKALKEGGDAVPVFDQEARWQAAGSVADWRATLGLLSRLQLADHSPKLNRRLVRLKDTDPQVVNSFFVNLTEGKRPNVAHLLLAHLADVLRIKPILTTNFDSLIELAFQRFDMPIATFDVHVDAGLPDARLVRRQRSVIKLHGTRFGLRADFSLDAPPEETDAGNFTRYLSFLDRDFDRNGGPCQRHLLVMGVSGEDRRTVALIGHAMRILKSGKNELRVYWICHSPKEIETVREAFESEAQKIGEPALKDRLRLTSASDLGLFLLELYQRIFLCLPPSGVCFSTVWPLPPVTLGKPDQRVCEDGKKLSERIQAEKGSSSQKKTDRLVPWSAGRDTPEVGAWAFGELSLDNHCIWVEVEHPFDQRYFMHSVLDAIARELGVSRVSSPMEANPQTLDHFKPEFESLIDHAFRPLVLFLLVLPESVNAIDDDVHNSVQWISRLSDELVTVVLVSNPALLDKFGVKQAKSETWENHDKTSQELQISNLTDHLNRQSTKERRDFARFILVIGLFRRPCYYAGLLVWATLKSSAGSDANTDRERSKNAERYLSLLRKWKAVREYEGRRVRIDTQFYAAAQGVLGNELGTEVDKVRKEGHQGIADWYMKLYRASGDVHAALESIDHRLDAAHPDLNGDQVFLHGVVHEIGLTLKIIEQAEWPSRRPESLLESWVRIEKKLLDLCEKSSLFNETFLSQRSNVVRFCAAFYDLLNWSAPPTLRDEFKRGPKIPRQSTHKADDEETFHQFRASVHERRYCAADKLLSECLAKFKANSLMEGVDTRESVNNWVKELLRKSSHAGGVSRSIPQLIRVVRMAQTLRRYEAETYRVLKESNRGPRSEESTKLDDADRLYIVATELLRHVNDVQFVHLESALLRGGAGIILARKNGLAEAYRRYNEAYGYLNWVSSSLLPLHFATVDLFRAETFLTEFRRLDSPYQDNRAFGLLYDALASVDRADYKVGSSISNGRWWSWLRQLEMEVCCSIASWAYARKDRAGIEAFSQCRDRGRLGSRFVASVRSGLLLCGEDLFRLARYTALCRDFSETCGDTYSKQYSRQDHEALKDAASCVLEKLKKVLAEFRGKPGYCPNVLDYANAQL